MQETQMKLQGKETGGMLSGLAESVWAALGCGHDSFEWCMLLQPSKLGGNKPMPDGRRDCAGTLPPAPSSSHATPLLLLTTSITRTASVY